MNVHKKLDLQKVVPTVLDDENSILYIFQDVGLKSSSNNSVLKFLRRYPIIIFDLIHCRSKGGRHMCHSEQALVSSYLFQIILADFQSENKKYWNNLGRNYLQKIFSGTKMLRCPAEYEPKSCGYTGAQGLKLMDKRQSNTAA